MSTKTERYLKAVESLNQKYGLRLDAKKVLRKISGKRPGKHCVGKSGKGSYISADKQCADHKNEAGKLTESGKISARELAGKVRKRKGMKAVNKASDRAIQALPDLKGTEKQVEWAKILRASFIDQVDRYHDQRIASIEKRIKDPQRSRAAKEDVWEGIRDKHLALSAPYSASFIDRMKNRDFSRTDPNTGGFKQELLRNKEVPEDYRDGTWMKDHAAFRKELEDRGLTDYAPDYAKPYL